MSTHKIPFFNLKMKITLNYLKSTVILSFQGTQDRAVVNEPSVFEPLKVYCMMSKITTGICCSFVISCRAKPCFTDGTCSLRCVLPVIVCTLKIGY